MARKTSKWNPATLFSELIFERQDRQFRLYFTTRKGNEIGPFSVSQVADMIERDTRRTHKPVKR